MTNHVLTLAEMKTSCRYCHQRSQCVASGLSDDALARFLSALARRQVLKCGETLFRQGDACATLYVLRSGALKTYTVDTGGDEQVLGFELPGEVLGIAAMSTGRYPVSAVALETSSVCVLPVAELVRLTNEMPTVQRQLYRACSRTIVRDYELLQLLSKPSADQRVGLFLRQLARRVANGGNPADTFNLSMSRQDISNYLGLAQETVCRVLSRFQRHGILAVARRRVTVLDHDRLAALAGETDNGAGRRLAG